MDLRRPNLVAGPVYLYTTTTTQDKEYICVVIDPYHHLKDRLLWMFALKDYARAEAIAKLPLTSDMQPSTLSPGCLGFYLQDMLPVSSCELLS